MLYVAETLIGDALLAAAFVSYAGAFNATLRQHLVEECWVPDAQKRKIPQAQGVGPLDLLTTGALQVSTVAETRRFLVNILGGKSFWYRHRALVGRALLG